MGRKIGVHIGPSRKKLVILPDVEGADLLKIKLACLDLLQEEPELLTDLGCSSMPAADSLLVFYQDEICGEIELGKSESLLQNIVTLRVKTPVASFIQAGKICFYVCLSYVNKLL